MYLVFLGSVDYKITKCRIMISTHVLNGILIGTVMLDIYHRDFFALLDLVSRCIRVTMAGIRLVGSFSGVFGIPLNILLNIPEKKTNLKSMYELQFGNPTVINIFGDFLALLVRGRAHRDIQLVYSSSRSLILRSLHY